MTWLAISLFAIGAGLLIAVLWLDRLKHPRFWQKRVNQQCEWEKAFPGKLQTVESFLIIFVGTYRLGKRYIWGFHPDDHIATILRAKYGQLGLGIGDSEDFVEELENKLGFDLSKIESIDNPKLRDYISA